MTNQHSHSSEAVSKDRTGSAKARTVFPPLTLGAIHGCLSALWTLQHSSGLAAYYATINGIPSLLREDLPKGRHTTKELPSGESGTLPSDPRDPVVGHVGMICFTAAYTVELCLKRIACMTRADCAALKDHNLAKLYQDLPWKVRDRLETEFRSKVVVTLTDKSTGQVKQCPPDPIEHILAEYGDVFVDARYLVEARDPGSSKVVTVKADALIGVAGFLVSWISRKEGFQDPTSFPSDKTLKITLVDKDPPA